MPEPLALPHHAQAFIADLARRYRSDDPPRVAPSVAAQQRVTFRLRLVSFHDHHER